MFEGRFVGEFMPADTGRLRIGRLMTDPRPPMSPPEPRGALTSVRPSVAPVLLRYGATALVAFALFGLILAISGRIDRLVPGHPGLDAGQHVRAVGSDRHDGPTGADRARRGDPSRVGLINVGGEGQLIMGACLSTWGALTFAGLPAWSLLPIMVLLGMIGGAAWACHPRSSAGARPGQRDDLVAAAEPGRRPDRLIPHLRLLAFANGHEQDRGFVRVGPSAQASRHAHRPGPGHGGGAPGPVLVRHALHPLGS